MNFVSLTVLFGMCATIQWQTGYGHVADDGSSGSNGNRHNDGWQTFVLFSNDCSKSATGSSCCYRSDPDTQTLHVAFDVSLEAFH